MRMGGEGCIGGIIEQETERTPRQNRGNFLGRRRQICWNEFKDLV